MGYALTYRRIITKIEENEENQQFEANFAQYGQIINQLFLSITVKDFNEAGLDDEVYLQSLVDAQIDTNESFTDDTDQCSQLNSNLDDDEIFFNDN